MSTSKDQSESSQRKAGRRKIPMEKIEKKSDLQATFSKRRPGLFKKASELCTLTGAEAGIVVFSPGDKAHSFGHPNINSITDKFLAPENINVGNQWIEDQDLAQMQQSEIDDLTRVEENIVAEKARGEELVKLMRENLIPFGSPSLEGLGYEQLQSLKEAVTQFGNDVNNMVGQMPFVPPGTNVGVDNPFGVEPTTMAPNKKRSGSSGSGTSKGKDKDYHGKW
ncbi:agamous-like MADS-box protein AGL29 [Andrographis paniculata]|uniref:agamous-like MADS-box protein AGL29 n=1 Tax=Andrographis paniculata TaxID=175694 RepID=UPI0021E946A8|nr:agamous-like MADS-box protein AGL29 [Andrographis paniculata]